MAGTRIATATLVLLAAALTTVAAGPPPTAPAASPAPYAPSMTMADRIRQSPLNQAMTEDVLALPHTDTGGMLPAPRLVPSGSMAARYPDIDRLVWAVVPKTDKRAEYLKVRDEFLKDGNDQALIAWCLRERLPACAEFEMRRVLRRIWNFRNPEYQTYRRQWITLAAKRQIPYTFPLPLEGEWAVLPDKMGHHAIKHGAAFAFDLVIQAGGRLHGGNGRRLEDYHCWGRPILAQADGVVLQAEDAHSDLPPGRSGAFDKSNYVGVYYGGGVGGFYGHIRQGSLRVKVGDRVTTGQPLASVGNSGASGMPHLHFTMTDMSSFSVRGRFCYQVQRAGRWVPVRGEDLREGTVVRPWSPPPAGVPADAAEAREPAR